jgi:tetratricopeptide (TPR) repeat protein
MDDHASLIHEAVQDHLDGRLDAAESKYRLVLSQGRTAEAAYLLGLVLMQKGDAGEAARLLAEAAAADPERPDYHICLGDALLASGRIDGAIAAYAEACYRAPQDPDPHLALGRLLVQAQMPEEGTRILQTALDIAEHRAAAGAVAEAAALAHRIADAGPTLIVVQRAAAALLARLNDAR